VRYSANTFTLYADLFKEAHDALIKEGRVGRFRQFLGRLADPSMARRAEGLAAQVAEHEPTMKSVVDQLAGTRFENAAHLGRIENLTKEVKTLGARPGALTEAEQAATKARTGRNVALGVGAAGLGVGVPAAYAVGHGQGSADKTRTRNIAFGAGTAAGIAAPHLIRGLGSIARGAGQSGAFPELEGMGEGGYY
jgi:hypothetical protein